MTAAAQLLSPLVAYTNSDYNEVPFRFWVGAMNAADSFAGYTFDAGLKQRGSGALTVLTSTAGTLVVTLPNLVAFAVPRATMNALSPGTYDFDLRKISAAGVKTAILRGSVNLVQGIAPV